jgi:hypothetical protein
MEPDPSISFAIPLLLFPSQEHEINKQLLISEDYKWKRISSHLLKVGHKILHNELDFLWRSSKQMLNSSNLFNPLNSELNLICHLLVLLGDLTFMGVCNVSIFRYKPPTAHSNQFQLFHDSGR